MERFRVVRDLFLIFTLSFTVIMIVTLLAGAEYKNADIVGIFILSAIYAFMALIFFWNSLIDKIGYLPLEIGYVVMLNIAYLILSNIFEWNFTVRGYLINFSSTVIMYIFVKIIIFSIDKVNADKINDTLKKRKSGGGNDEN